MEISEVEIEKINDYQSFISKILFYDFFHRTVNKQSWDIWAKDNLHKHTHNDIKKIDVWIGNVGDNTVKSLFIDKSLNQQKYLVEVFFCK